jgi:membrane-bound serine protease (ClpP class)
LRGQAAIWWRVLLLIGLFLVGFSGSQVSAADGDVLVIEAKGTINPILARHIQRGIDEAEAIDAELCVILLDTPGGLDTAMRDIVQSITNAEVPVAVYVGPSGARAASAGVFITLSGHIAAMSPNTAIGAASPVAMGADGEVEMSDTMKEKVLNDSAAYIRSLAEAKDRNLEWAELAVREAVSATEQEALELNVIDLVAANLADLLKQVNGQQITLLDGTVVTLDTAGALSREFAMGGIDRFLFAISDPNIAYLLMGLAMLGIFVEISNPGLIFPGMFGAIALLLALLSLGTLPINLAGILLILLAVGLFVAEVFTSSFGLFTAGGVTALTIGSIILFKGGPLFQVNPWLIALVVILVTAFFVFVVTKLVRVHKKHPTMGADEFVGLTAVVKIKLDPEGSVLIKGERWTARSESGTIEADTEVTVTRRDGFKLWVTPKTE